MRRATAMKLLEKDIEKTCTQFLEFDGWRSLKTDPVSRREWGKGFGELGMADHLYIRYVGSTVGFMERDLRSISEGTMIGAVDNSAEVMWIEWKRKGGKAAQRQTAWHTLERKRGALTLIAGEDFPASIEGFQDWYRGSGLQRRADR